MVPTNKKAVGIYATSLSRRRRRALGLLASAALVVPVSMCGGATINLVDAASGAMAMPQLGQLTVPQVLGATGMLPHDSALSPMLQHDAGNPNALLTSLGSAADLPSGPLGLPGIVLQAYLQAQQTMATQQPSCNLPWWLLAGIGKIESGQAENGEVDASGNTLRPILGPELNGSNGFAALPAINGGEWTGDPNWQRAVGPMQFLPSTWLEWGNGGNPNNVFDAALAAGRYLCAGGRNLADPAQQAVAVFSYNHSNSYVEKVLVWAYAYRQGVTPLPPIAVPPANPQTPTGPGTTNSGPPTTGPGTSSNPTTPPSSSTSPTSPTSPTTSSSAPPTTTPTCPADPTTTTGSPTSTATPTPPTGTTTPPPPGCTTSPVPTTTGGTTTGPVAPTTGGSPSGTSATGSGSGTPSSARAS